MDDAWAVVYGAVIALVASVVGGFMSSVLGPLLARHAEKKERIRSATEARQSVVQKAILDASLGLRAYSLARYAEDHDKTSRVMNEVEDHMLRLRLWTSEEEKDVADRLMHVLSIDDVEETSAAAWTWEQLAARWFRKSLSSADFSAEYEKTRTDRLLVEKDFKLKHWNPSSDDS